MIIPFVIFAVVVLTLLVGLLIYVYPSTEKVSTVPGLDPSSERDGNIPDITRAGSLPEFLQELHDEFGDIASFWMGKQYVVSIASPELFKEISHVFDRPNILYSLFAPLLGTQSIQYANGGTGKERRKIHDRSFSHEKVVKGIPMFQQIGEELANKWSSVSSDEHIALSLEMSSITLTALTRFAFGDYFKNQNDLIAFRKVYDSCFEAMENTLVAGPLKPGTPEEKKFNEALEVMKDTVTKILKQREAAEVAPEDKVFIDSLLDNYDNEDMIFDDVMTYMIGGLHTTAFFLTWALYFLATHEDVQDKVYKEIKEVYKSGPITAETLKNTKYLLQVMDETLRCSNLAPYAARHQNFESSLDGHKIPQDTPVIHALGVIMNNEKIFPHPTRFDPERFAEGKSFPPLAFEPFGFAGKRKCPGYRLSNVETQVFLICLLNKFQVKLVPGQVVNHKYGLVTKPEDEVWITVEKRK